MCGEDTCSPRAYCVVTLHYVLGKLDPADSMSTEVGNTKEPTWRLTCKFAPAGGGDKKGGANPTKCWIDEHRGRELEMEANLQGGQIDGIEGANAASPNEEANWGETFQRGGKYGHCLSVVKYGQRIYMYIIHIYIYIIWSTVFETFQGGDRNTMIILASSRRRQAWSLCRLFQKRWGTPPY